MESNFSTPNNPIGGGQLQDNKIAQSNLASKKRKILRIAIFVLGVVIIILTSIIIFAIYQNNKKPVSFAYNVCREKDLDNALDFYKNKNNSKLESLIYSLRNNDYQKDAKCLYINLLYYDLTDAGIFYKEDYNLYKTSEDFSNVDKLVKIKDSEIYGKIVKK